MVVVVGRAKRFRAHQRPNSGGRRCGGNSDLGRAGGRWRFRGHRLRVPDRRKGRWILIGSTDTTHTVTGLVNDTVYTFQVRTVTRIGRSQPSDPAEATPIAQVV